MKLLRHGIMICTLGSFQTIIKKFPDLKHLIFDLVVDEAGQVWEFDLLCFMWHLPKLMRWAVFGDQYQMTPYITKLLKDDRYFPSIMTLMDLTPHQKIHLVLQYRTHEHLCRIHAPVFYDYDISSKRKEPDNPDHDGLFVECLSAKCTIEDEVRRAIEIYQDIKGRQLKTKEGKPYCFLILTHYI